jgi:hypothetical protein
MKYNWKISNQYNSNELRLDFENINCSEMSKCIKNL